ncbi:MAG: TRAM domain-containing protein [Candidatus Omnitrophica bacterium]|nr:TRAM domain-containing protein [Candidatus Omnitrophota bacterium]
MTIIFVRIFFMFLSVVAGYYIGSFFSDVNTSSPIIGGTVGLLCAGLLILSEMFMRKVSTRNLSAGLVGLIFGIFMSWILTTVIKLIPMNSEIFLSIQIVLTLIFCYLGMVISLRGKDEFSLIIPYVKFDRRDQAEELIILDTSVIIDGRIADICQTKFISGHLVIPRFVLKELQQVADSNDTLKRNRGRRGLDILNKMQKNPSMNIKIADEDFPEITDVDAKLIKMATVLSGKIVTNDYNLNKIAELQGVTVLNINDLANALRPVVLPGEVMQVRITKEGKEYNQGVAYLDDGTMVVVDNARYLIGQALKVIVTSVLQTSAGRMIFAKLEEGDKRR